MKTFKFRLYPTRAQRTAMNKSLGACRLVYNKTLEVRRDAWQERHESVSLYDTHKLLTQWKQECSGCGAVVPKDLSVRVHDCPHCGLKLDRDLNAARNILARGLTRLGTKSLEAP